jgi:uncharacterized protein
MKSLTTAFLLVFLTHAGAQNNTNLKNVSALVFTKNGKGYVHDNIPYAVACIKKLGADHGFKVESTDDPSVFTTDNLKNYSLIIFPSTNNDVFDNDEQRLAFRKFIEAGGGFVGLHSVLGTERNWKWFKKMVGGTFAWHPKFQRYRIVSIDQKHPSLSGIPPVWEKEDECYFQKEMNPGIQVIMAHDLTTLTLNETDKEKLAALAGPYTELYPAVWHHVFDGGPVWITALGHDKKDYEDEVFVLHILNGIRFVASQVKKTDFGKAYAASRDEEIRY